MGAKLKTLGLVSIGALAGALTTLQLSVSAGPATAQLPHEELQQLAYAFNIIKSSYVDKVDERKLITDAIGGMVSGLDPHSQFFDRKALKDFREGTSGKFSGIGIEIGSEDGLVKVVSPIEGSPAFRAGLKSADLITKIDDTAVKGLALNDAVKRMRGEPNTKVLLTVFRKDENRTFPVTIVREQIRTQSVRGKVVEPGYAWVRLSQFQERTVDDFVKKIDEIYKQEPNLKGLVLDLRNDPGGLLDGAVAVSSAFLPENVTVVSTNGQLAESKFTFKASPEFYQRRSGPDPLKKLPAALKTVPLVVLVNEGSASASEIVAGALQDWGRAVIVGTTSFGKGSVQTILPLGDGSGLRLTTAKYYTPKGRSIQSTGITPDIVVKLQAQTVAKAGDKDAKEAEPKSAKAPAAGKDQASPKPADESAHKNGAVSLGDAGGDISVEDDVQLQKAVELLKTWKIFKRLFMQLRSTFTILPIDTRNSRLDP